jgi:class 3 adenylate cyclase
MAGNRKIAAILVADVVGYGRLAGADEDRTLSRLRGLRSDLIDPAIAAHHGRIVKRTGDGSLVEFRSVVDAVRCAIEVQNGLVERNASVAPEHRIEFRVGIHLGDVVALRRPGMGVKWRSSHPREGPSVINAWGADSLDWEGRCTSGGRIRPRLFPCRR